MSLARWSPLREFEEFFNQYPRLGKATGGASQELMTAADWAPAVDISETPQAYLIKAELAGMRREDMNGAGRGRPAAHQWRAQVR